MQEVREDADEARMRPWLKGLLIGFGALIVVGAAAGGGGYWWWQQHRGALIADLRAAIAEGRRFAAGKDKQACVDEGITRIKSSSGMTGAVTVQSFLTGCLVAARPTAGFCDGMPAPDEILSSGAWNQERRAKYGLSPFEWPFVLGTIQRFCAAATGKGK